MRTPCKRLLCLVLCLLMIVSCIPAVGAENDIPTRDYTKNELHTDKVINLEEDGTYTITLESFVTGSVDVATTPMDIVLVMDQSASMVNNVMTEMPKSVYNKYLTPASGFTYYHLQSLPKLIYLPGDSYYYEAKVELTSNGTVKGRYTLNDTNYVTTAYSKDLAMYDGSTVALNGYHASAKQLTFVLGVREESEWWGLSTTYYYYYYNAKNTSEKSPEFTTIKEAYEYMQGTYLTEKYSDYTAIQLTSGSSTYMNEVYYCLPIQNFRWENTQYKILYYSNAKEDWLEGEVDTCGYWYTATPEFPTDASEIAAKCGSSKLFYFTRSDALQNAAHEFVLKIQELSEAQGTNHRIAVVGFSGGKLADSEAASSVTTDYYGTELLSTEEKINYSSATTENYQDAMQPVLNTDGTENTRLMDAIARISGYSTTYPVYGLDMANKILSARTDKTFTVGGEERDRKTIVIIFTDGVPGNFDKLGSFADYTDCGPIKTANRSIEAAKTLKTTGAEVYCIGMLEGADPTASYNFQPSTYTNGTDSNGNPLTYPCYAEEKDAINAFLHFLSSDYPGASDMATPDRSTVVNNGYFYAAKTSEALNQAFENISAVVSGTEVKLNEHAIVKDVMADGFNLPEGIDDYAEHYITVSTATYLGKDSEKIWADPVVFDEAIITTDETTKTVCVTNFNYSENFVHEASSDGSVPAGGKKLIVTIKGIAADDNAVQNGLVNTNAPSSGIYENGQLETIFQAFEIPTVLLQTKSFVLDYFASAEISPEEVGVFTPLHLSAEGMGRLPTNDDGSFNYTKSLECANGTVELIEYTDESGATAYKLLCTPTTADFHEIDCFYVFGKDAKGENTWSKISILPANNVFYEDGWATYSGQWTELEKRGVGNTETFNNPVHGYIESKANERYYSNGTANYSNTTGSYAEFTFTGTGIDVYCQTDGKCGITLALLTPDGAEVASKCFMVDNYSASGTYYQIPTIFFHDLDYKTYILKIMVVENGARNDYYLDGFRVYNPLGRTEDITKRADCDLIMNAYGDEFGSTYTTIRELLINPPANVESGVTGEGAFFIDEIKDEDGNSTTGVSSNAIATYKDYGPKNEVYLQYKNGISLKVDPNAHYYIGIKAPNGSAKVSFSYGVDDTGMDVRKEVDINGASDLYYEVIPSANGIIYIENISDTGIISLTKLRTCSGTGEDLSLYPATTEEILTYANSFDSLALAEAPTIGASTHTKAPKQPKAIFRNIKKPIIGREQQ